MSSTAHAQARAIVVELIRGRLANASIEVVQTVGWLMMMRSESVDATYVIGHWFAAMTERGREQIFRIMGEAR